MSPRFPLPTLLSYALVAFIIEFDNEVEHRMPHRTTEGVSSLLLSGPWLVSMVMWVNCLEHVEDGGITVREIERRARTRTNWRGMQRWGYVRIAPDPNDSRPKPPARDWVVRAKPGGRNARDVGRPVFGEIEKRWRERFGEREMDRLRDSLWAIAQQIDKALPDCLPILGYGLFSGERSGIEYRPVERAGGQDTHLPLSALLSRVLLAFAIDFEGESEISLAICANLLRVLDEEGVRLRDLPRVSGVSKESLSMAMGILRKGRLAAIEAEKAGSRTKVARLTAKGREAQDAYRKLLAAIEKRWETRFGDKAIGALRESLEAVVGDAKSETSRLFRAIEPYPDGWRASKPKPETLPHYPMVLHRGGYPDGS
ncbi:MAG TPA: hypothetical protein VHX36_00535 [Candidatus Acidoferrales bacterium]|nr:hypothetical protein [Candidatus Acidoferrales bacterium]